MTTAVDSSVLLDVLGADRRFGPASRDALRRAYDAGALLACDVVWAEVRAHYPSHDSFEEALDLIGVRYDAVAPEAARLAGELWRRHLSKPGSGRRRLVADFLIGAHALKQADSLLTRDRGFYRRYFAELKVTDPARG